MHKCGAVFKFEAVHLVGHGFMEMALNVYICFVKLSISPL